MSERLFLMPGKSVGKKGLPGGKIECKDGSNPFELSDKILKVIEPNIEYLKAVGVLSVNQETPVPENDSPQQKSDKRTALEKEADVFEVEYTDKTTAKEIQAMIDQKKELLQGDDN